METIDLLKQTAARAQEIMSACQQVNDGIIKLCASLAQIENGNAPEERRLDVLTPRQRQIFDFITSGVSVADIAKSLKLSARTVEAHRNTIRIRLKFGTVLELNQFAQNLKKR